MPRRDLPPCPAHGGYTNPPPTSMDLAMLDAVLNRVPFTPLGAYLRALKQEGIKPCPCTPT